MNRGKRSRPAKNKPAGSKPVVSLPAQSHIKPVDERTKAGKLLRERCPLKTHGDWKPFARRVDPIDLLIENSRGRVEELLPIRYGRMMTNPFAFFRGAAAIMDYDLSHTPATGVVLQACGDCHLLNFGGFATAERKNIFDINDFDESSVAPWEWDIKRLTASFVVAGRSNDFDAADCREAAWLAARDYREHMAEYGRSNACCSASSPRQNPSTEPRQRG